MTRGTGSSTATSRGTLTGPTNDGKNGREEPYKVKYWRSERD